MGLIRATLARFIPGLRTAPGKQRWSVKTGTDPDAPAVALTPVLTTVEQLRALAPPAHPDRLTRRLAPVETTVLTVSATLVYAHLEADGDYHLVLQDGTLTMIAEIPDPAYAAGSTWGAQITAARAAFDANFGVLGGGPLRPNRAVTVTGVGFFDPLHGQVGVAPNGIELHPVLALEIAAK